MDIFSKLRRTQKDIEKEKKELQEIYQTGALISRKKIVEKRAITSKQIRSKKTKRKIRKNKKKVVSKKMVKSSGKKKKGSKQRSPAHQEHNLLKEVLNDLNKELRLLRSSRNKLEMKSTEYSEELGKTQTTEIKLRNQISELMRKEAELTKKKTEVKDKILTLSKKIDKVASISRQVKE